MSCPYGSAQKINKELEAILDAAGTTFGGVVRNTDYITTNKNDEATAEIRRHNLSDNFLASTGTIMKGLLSEGARIEIDSLALLDQMRFTSSKAS